MLTPCICSSSPLSRTDAASLGQEWPCHWVVGSSSAETSHKFVKQSRRNTSNQFIGEFCCALIYNSFGPFYKSKNLSAQDLSCMWLCLRIGLA